MIMRCRGRGKSHGSGEAALGTMPSMPGRVRACDRFCNAAAAAAAAAEQERVES